MSTDWLEWPNMAHGAGTVTAATLNVREWAGTDAPILAKLGQGTRLTVWARRPDNWLLVQTGDGVTGWVSGLYVKIEGELVRSLRMEAGMADPRAANCRGFQLGPDGRVTGVELQYREVAGSRYQLISASLIDEAQAQGNTVATCNVVDANGLPVSAPVYLAWPWPGLDNRLLPGNPDNRHMITNGYNPPNIGPLALYVGDSKGNPISDVIGGLGLPLRRHVSYALVWRERAAAPEPEPPPDDPDEPTDGETVRLLREMHDDLRALRAHLGA
jgi:hypothetical protein